jgi:pectin methylesterase-like acyl-CoA thioesterase
MQQPSSFEPISRWDFFCLASKEARQMNTCSREYQSASWHTGIVRLGAMTVFLTAMVSHASAANRSVCASGCTYSTIQSAINAASTGDTILIGKGHYVETLVVFGKRLTLQGADSRTTVVDGNGAGTVVTIGNFNTPSNTPVALSNLTITRGFGSNGGGIAVLNGGSLTLRHSVVVGNHSSGDGGGINAFSDSAVTIADSTITNNDATEAGGGVAATGESTTFQILRSTVSANRATQGFGGGISLTYDGSKITLQDTDIVDNSASSAGGAFLGGGVPADSLTVQNVSVIGNASSSDTGGLWIGAPATLGRVVIAHNSAATRGGGMTTAPAFRGGGVVTLGDVYVVQNKAAQAGGIFNGASLTLSATVIADNQPDNCVESATPAGTGCP